MRKTITKIYGIFLWISSLVISLFPPIEWMIYYSGGTKIAFNSQLSDYRFLFSSNHIEIGRDYFCQINTSKLFLEYLIWIELLLLFLFVIKEEFILILQKMVKG